MGKRIVSKNEETGKTTYLHDAENGKMIIESQQNVDGLIEANKRQANEWEYGKLIGNTQAHHQKVAEIPSIIYMQLREKYGDMRDNPKAWKRWLNDPENRFFRTSGGSL
jgi:hypothetical protein